MLDVGYERNGVDRVATRLSRRLKLELSGLSAFSGLGAGRGATDRTGHQAVGATRLGDLRAAGGDDPRALAR